MTEAPTIAGRLTGLLNANQSTYGFQYNPVGRLLREAGFDGSQTQYDASTGMLKQVSDAIDIRARKTTELKCWLSLKTDPPFAFKIDPPSVGDYT